MKSDINKSTLAGGSTFIALFLVSLLLGNVAFAAQESTPTTPPPGTIEFGLNPTSDSPNGYFEVELSPGESRTITAAVMNLGSEDLSLIAYVANAVHPPNGGFSAAELGVEEIGVTSWIEIEEPEFVSQVGSEFTIAAEINVPDDAVPGQHIAALVVSTKSALPIPGVDNLKQILRNAIPLVVQIPGEIRSEFEIGTPRSSQDGDFVSLEIPIINRGNIRVQPTGKLTLRDADGTAIAEFDIAMESIYAWNTADLYVSLPSQMASGEFLVDLTLEDPDTGASNSISGQAVVIEASEELRGLVLASQLIEPNADEIVFANVEITLNNGGPQIAATDVNLEVLRDGELVDTFPLATNQVMLEGENTYTTRYIPADMWEPGVYTFRITVSAVSADGTQQIELLNEPLDAEIVVP